VTWIHCTDTTQTTIQQGLHAASQGSCKALYVSSPAGKGEEKYDQQAFATFFPDDIGAITSAMDDFVDALRSSGGPDQTVVDQYISYISHYRCKASSTLLCRP
jgi:hypothetical protein